MIGETLRLSRLVKRYGGFVAVDGIDLDVGAGEFMSVLGPSGSGKTSVLTMIAGFERPHSGSISIGASDVTVLAPNKRNIGMVFQKYALFPHLTVRQNIAFPLKLTARWKSHWLKRADDMLELVQLSSFADRLPSELSGGQQQRAAVARALAFEPPVMLMDEPLGALDKKLREAMQLEIKRMQKSVGATVLYVTHDQEEALTMSDRVAVMHGGRIVQIGTPTELYHKPNTAFVADFIGKTNFLNGKCVGSQDGTLQIRLSDTVLLTVDECNSGSQAPVHIGDEVCVALRPETVTLRSSGEAGTNRMTGTIESSVFTGTHQVIIIRLSLPGTPSMEVQLSHDEASFYRAGQLVEVVTDPRAIACFTSPERAAA